MPKYTPTDEEMDSSYAEETVAGAPDTPEGEAAEESVDEENAGNTEVLVAKSQLPSGTKEGDTCTFKVIKDFGDEVSLEYVKSGVKPESTNDTMIADTENEIAALDTEKA